MDKLHLKLESAPLKMPIRTHRLKKTIKNAHYTLFIDMLNLIYLSDYHLFIKYLIVIIRLDTFVAVSNHL